MGKRDLIINAALKLFVENGFHGTATSKIAQEAGVATGTLFQYFKSKDELVIAIYLQFKEDMFEYVSNHTDNKTDIKETIKTNILASLHWALDNPTKFHFFQQFHTSPYLGQVEQEVLNRQLEPHLALIKKGIQTGVLKSMPADLIYSLISNQVFGVYQYINSKTLSKSKKQELIEITFEMLWDMVT
jgi:AcrR family transcriptional regulator